MSPRLTNYLGLLAVFFIACNSKGNGQVILECGGAAKFACPSGTYCELGESCGGIDKLGICRQIPQNCPDARQTVCGCDGKTHTSRCYANASGVSVNYEGACLSQ